MVEVKFIIIASAPGGHRFYGDGTPIPVPDNPDGDRGYRALLKTRRPPSGREHA
jgi:hypothetical protein